MEEINYKEIDRRKIIEYISKRGGQCLVDEIIKNSGANKLRVYPILFEESQTHNITVIEEENLGSPKVVKLSHYE